MSVLPQRPPPSASAPAARLLPLLVLAVTWAVLGEVVRGGFVRWDDNLHVTENPWLHPVTLAHIGHFWQTSYEGLYIPLSYTVYSLLALIARDPATQALNPHVFHAANLGLHLVNVLLVFALLKRLVGGAWAAAGGALLFGLHPVQVESVAWVSELRGLLSALFSLVALGQYWEFRQAPAGPRPWGRFVLATLAFGLALLAKPSAVAVPLMALVLDGWGRGRSWRLSLPLVLWASLALAEIVLSRTSQPAPAALLLPLWRRPFVAGDALAASLAHLVWPVALGIDYGRSPATVLAHPGGYLTWLAPACLGVLLWRIRRSWPLLMVAGGLFLAALLPVLGLVPFAFQEVSTVADRYAYLAMLGPALAAACLLARVPRRAVPLAAGLSLAVLLLLGLQSALQVMVWQNDFALFSRALAVNPRSWVADNDLGATLYEHGQTEQAIRAFQNGLRWNPYQEKAWNNLGAALNTVGRRAEAEVALQNALRLAPDYAAAYNNLGLVSTGQGRLAAAEAEYRRALRLDPDFAEAQNNLGVLLDRQGKWTAAAEQFQRALAVRPGYASALRNLAGMTAARQNPSSLR